MVGRKSTAESGSLRVLFVCLGNICRSPTAEAVFRSRVSAAGWRDRISIDSAGTSGWHVGDAPDRRAREAARRRGYDMDSLRGRELLSEDFYRFDLMLAMDRDNLQVMRRLAGPGEGATLDLFLGRYGIGSGEVPDPYGGGVDDFERVLDLVERASDALIEELRSEWLTP